MFLGLLDLCFFLLTGPLFMGLLFNEGPLAKSGLTQFSF